MERAAVEGRSNEGRWEGLRLGEVSNIVQIFVLFEYSFYSNIRIIQIFVLFKYSDKSNILFV